MPRHLRLRTLSTHALEMALRAAVVDVLTALEDEDLDRLLSTLWRVQREWDRRAAVAGVTRSCVCEECFRDYPEA